MADVILNHMTNGQNISTANTNFDKIQDNINNHSIQRDGGNNVMFQDFDLNGHSLLNLHTNVGNPGSALSVRDGDARYYLQHQVPNPTGASDAANRSYVDASIAGVVGGFGSFVQNGTGAVVRTFQSKMRESVTPLDFGALGDGVTDDTAAFAYLQTYSGVIDGLGKTYVVNALNFTQKVTLRRITFKPSASFSGQTLITIAGNNSSLDLVVDASGRGFTCVDITGNEVTGKVTGNNITAVPQAAGGTQSACRVLGQYCNLSVYGENHLKGTSDNDSIPRLVTADLSGAGTGNNNTISVYGLNVNDGLVCSQAQVYAPEIQIDGLTDNGIYHLQGILDVGTLTLKNSLDESVVCEGTLHINKFHLIDPVGSSGLQNGNAIIDEFTIESTNAARSYVPFRTRTGNISSSLKIGTLRGEIWLADAAAGAGIFQFATGNVTTLSVDTLDLKVHYRTGSTTALMNHNTGDQVIIGDMRLELVDDTGTLTNSTKFTFTLPTALTKQSFLGAVNNVSSTGEIRVVNAIQTFMQLGTGMELSTNIGPYLLQENNTAPCPRQVIAGTIPTVGTWLRGDVVIMKTPAVGASIEYTCSGAGTPGTWRASKWLVNRGVTGSRPTLTANDVGVMYFDTTLAANGKPIWWTGTVWVDSTGTSV